MNELEDKRSTSDDALTSGQKVAADNGLEDGGLSRRLRADNDDLREVDSVSADMVEGVLELVHQGDEVAVHGHGVAVGY